MHWYLFPFSVLYRIIVSTRNKLFDWEWLPSKKFDIPIINVGNITIGGTGKTPHIEYLINLLGKKYTLGIISRGYKRKTKGFIEVKTQSTVKEVGDEPLQIKQKFQESLVIVDEKRVHAVEKLIAEDKTPDVLLLDDAYQHRHITPGLNILLIEHNRLITKDEMLPVGKLREPAHNSSRANIVILTKCPENLYPIDFRLIGNELNLFPYQTLFFTTFKYNGLKPLFKGSSKYKTIKDLKGVETIIVTGIANPKGIYKKLKKAGAKITKLSFPDHYNFKLAAINKIYNTYLSVQTKNKIILCTEKDAVRFKTGRFKDKLANLPIYTLPIEVAFLNNKEEKFKDLVENYINCS
ncbi:MAG: tetraacyldisaccharide 4'-kinase [Salinivirgaceae bacterium]|jgi:tetraacyldisaccharide 4'-kinase|nr:tetraacyldisaccharide 4'-kinase [Salinivirgaceae bacterium]